MSHIHIVDPDTRRRAAVSRFVLGLDFHPEIYESCLEFSKREHASGVVLVADAEASTLLDLLKLDRIGLPVIVYAEQPDTRDVVEAIRCGAADFLEWPVSSERLGMMLELAVQNGDRLATQRRVRSRARNLVNSLTSRELDVLLGVVDGGSNKSIAEELGISPRTVEIHRAHMMRKLNVGSIGEAVRIALCAQLVDEIDLAA